MSRLTILMPAYNAESFIEDAIHSLLNQTFRDFELWVIDDGSMDNTRKKVESISDLRIRNFFFDENRGRVAVVNRLISQVTTEFVTVTDADDVSHPTRLASQITLLDHNPLLMMCGTSYYAIDKDGNILREIKLSDNYSNIYKRMLKGPQFHGPTTIMRSLLIQEWPEFYRSFFSVNRADADLCARIVDKHEAINITESLYFYRIVKNSLSRKNYSIRFANLDKVIAFLSLQRRLTGTDNLMNKKEKELSAFENEIHEKYEKDASLIWQQGAFYHLFWRTYDLAIHAAWRACQIKPLHLKNIFSLFYVIMNSWFFKLKKKQHMNQFLNVLV